MKPNKTIKIMCWNANGLVNKREELASFLHTHNIDVALISKTHINTYSNRPKIQNYSVYIANHPSSMARGGSAILVKKCHSHHDIGTYVTDSIQASVISLQLHEQPLYISSIYCPPRCPPQESEFAELFRCLGHKWILGGDFNAKHPDWGSRLTTTRGRVLHSACQRFDCHPIPPSGPTHWPADPNKIPDVIDFFVVKGIPSHNVKSECEEDLSTDYLPVLLTISNTPTRDAIPQSLVNKTTNWDRYRELVHENVNLNVRIQNQDDLDEKAENFSAILLQSIRQCTKYTNRSVPSIEYPKFICSLISRRRKARKTWQRHRTHENKQKFNRLSKDTTKAIREWKNHTFHEYLTSLAPTKEAGYSLWAAAKHIRRPPPFNSPLRNESGSWAKSDQEKAELFALHFERFFQDNDLPSTIAPIESIIDSGKIKRTSPLEISEFIDKIDSRKSAGSDQILPKMT